MTALSKFLMQWEHAFQSMGWLGVLLFAGMIVVIQIFCAPLSPVAIAAGLFFGKWQGFLAVELGTTLGAALNFIVSRYFMRERFARWLGKHEKFRLIDAAIGREGWKIVALLRFCPIPFGLANYCYGLTAVRFVPYILATCVAIVPGNFFFVWFGATSHEAISALSGTGTASPPGKLVFSVIGIAAFMIALRYITKIAKAAIARGDDGEMKPVQGQVIEKLES